MRLLPVYIASAAILVMTTISDVNATPKKIVFVDSEEKTKEHLNDARTEIAKISEEKKSLATNLTEQKKLLIAAQQENKHLRAAIDIVNVQKAKDQQKTAEADSFKAEIERLKGVLATKNAALDKAIVEIKKMIAENQEVRKAHPALSEEFVAAFTPTDWDAAEFKEIGLVAIKAHKDTTIIKVPDSGYQAALKLLPVKSRSHYACGGQHCFVVSDKDLSK